MYDKSNFHRNTFCIFEPSEVPERKPDYESASGSQYWFGENGLFRKSNHWGRAATCKWRLAASSSPNLKRVKCGYANWSDFAPDIPNQKLYFIKVEGYNAHYFHKQSPDYRNEFLRDSEATEKRLRQVREFLKRGNDEPEILELLVNSDKPMHEIRRAVYGDNP